MRKARVGILALQGCVTPHIEMFKRLEVEAIPVRSARDLSQVTHLILPGGESTTMLKLLRSGDLWEPLQEFVREYPTWGICAGAILLAAEVINPEQECLHAIQLRAHRNFYGSQLESFTDQVSVLPLDRKITVDFIRAPHLEAISSAAVAIAFHKDIPVMFAQNNILASAFHSELGTDPALHEFFVKR